MPEKPPKTPKKGRPTGSASFAWRAFFQQASTPIFVLGKARRLRFANAAWEALTGRKLADVLGLVCSTRRTSTPLAAALAPTPEVLAGQTAKSRRPAPQHRGGPPWWDITFHPLRSNEGSIGIVGFIEVVGETVPAAARKIPPELMALREKHSAHFTLDRLGGESVAARRFLSQVRHAASATTPVWIVGEPGSGKETTARIIHRASARRERAFVSLDCGGLQPYLIESLLWGHGGLAGSDRLGTIFLKEPARLPRDLQQRFVDEYAESESGVRLICGSTRSAREAVKDGSLLSEFHTALSALEVPVPPLRDRIEDLPRLVADLLARHEGKLIVPAAMVVLQAHAWPGNLRELDWVLGDAATAAGEGSIQRDHLPRELRERLGIVKPAPPPDLRLDATLEAVEKQLILRALAKSNGNATKAAELLGIWRTRLLRRVEALGLKSPEGD